jgi:hypothetical protein
VDEVRSFSTDEKGPMTSKELNDELYGRGAISFFESRLMNLPL